jgi:hypothetical protein
MSDLSASVTIVCTPLPLAGATAYAPLPTEPSWERGLVAFAEPRPQPAPPAPGGPAYPPLPLETDTRDGGGGGRE